MSKGQDGGQGEKNVEAIKRKKEKQLTKGQVCGQGEKNEKVIKQNKKEAIDKRASWWTRGQERRRDQSKQKRNN